MTHPFTDDRVGPTTLERLREQQAPPLVDPEARRRIRAANTAAGRCLVVLDDDPTGSQVVHDVPVLTGWGFDDLRWAFRQRCGTFFILTNTRSMGAATARALLTDLATRIEQVAAELGVAVTLISRSDSTLRGHFPMETDALAEVAARHGSAYDAVVVIPAFLDAGRVTVDGVHYAQVQDRYVPVGQTQYADDDAFGYRSSDLRDWVREKAGDPDLVVASVSLDDIRHGGVAGITGRLLDARGGAVVIVDALDESDLDAVALALVAAETTGWRAIYRVGPSFVPARAGMQRRRPLTAREIFVSGRSSGRGLVVVGSHVDLTTRQVARLCELDGIVTVELDVGRLLTDGGASRELNRCTRELLAASAHDDVLLVTSRERVAPHSGESSLDFARVVSTSLVELTRRVVASIDLSWVVAKGGITSHDIATDGLQIRRATVLGQLFDGIVSVWRNRSASTGERLAGLPYVVFAGNVGGETNLRDAVTILREGRPPGSPNYHSSHQE